MTINEKIIKMNINIFDEKVTILVLYGISHDETSIKKETFCINSNNAMKETVFSREIIMMRDFKGRTRNNVQRMSEERLPQKVLKWLQP